MSRAVTPPHYFEVWFGIGLRATKSPTSFRIALVLIRCECAGCGLGGGEAGVMPILSQSSRMSNDEPCSSGVQNQTEEAARASNTETTLHCCHAWGKLDSRLGRFLPIICGPCRMRTLVRYFLRFGGKVRGIQRPMGEMRKHAGRRVWLRERFFAGEGGLHSIVKHPTEEPKDQETASGFRSTQRLSFRCARICHTRPAILFA